MNNYMNIIRNEKITRIAVSSQNYNSYNIDLDNSPQKVILNQDSIGVIINGILNAKGYSYSHPLINCDFMIRIYFKNSESIDCNVFNSSNNATVFVLYKLNKERIGNFRNDNLNNIICEFLEER